MQPSWKRNKNSLHQSGAKVAILEFESLQKHFFKNSRGKCLACGHVGFQITLKSRGIFLQFGYFTYSSSGEELEEV